MRGQPVAVGLPLCLTARHTERPPSSGLLVGSVSVPVWGSGARSVLADGLGGEQRRPNGDDKRGVATHSTALLWMHNVSGQCVTFGEHSQVARGFGGGKIKPTKQPSTAPTTAPTLGHWWWCR
jgi:hypothetical protein